MVTIERVQRGVAAYISNELEPQLDGFKKWAFAIAASELVSTVLPAYLKKLSQNEMVALTGMISEDLSIDIERLYKRVRPAAERSPARIELPIIGGITFNCDDVDALYNCIMRA